MAIQLRRVAAGLALVPAVVFAAALIGGGVWLFAIGEGGGMALLAAATGGLALPGIVKLYHTATRPEAPRPVWWAWLSAGVVIALPAWFAYSFVTSFNDFYFREKPLLRATGEMENALRDVADAQQAYLKATGRFAGDIRRLDSIERVDRWTPGPEVTLSITGADAARWSATAEHRDVTTTCSIAGGGDGPSEPVCVPGTLRRATKRP